MLSFMLIISFVFWIISVSLCFYLCLFNYSSIFHNQYFVIPKWLFIKPNTFYIRWNTAMYLSLNECDDVDLCSFEKWLKNHDSFRISTGTITNNCDYFYSFIWFVFFSTLLFFSFSLFLVHPMSSKPIIPELPEVEEQVSTCSFFDVFQRIFSSLFVDTTAILNHEEKFSNGCEYNGTPEDFYRRCDIM